MFDALAMAPPDPILGLTEAFKKDTRPNKINLGVGVYVDSNGKTPVFGAVRAAEGKILAAGGGKSYLPIPGSAEFAGATERLVLGDSNPVLAAGRVGTAHTPGGTGALRVAGDFLNKACGVRAIWVSKPTWTNHVNIFQAANLRIEEYRYYDAKMHALDLEGMIAAIHNMPEGDAILLHGCCHNPTGVDPTPEQWGQIAAAVKSRKLVAVVDLAYLGFGQGLDQDRAGVNVLVRELPELLICASYSKNFGLYNERVGALLVVAESADATEKAFSHVKSTIRANYSNPPSHGGAIIPTILNDEKLRQEWQTELDETRGRINKMRAMFAEKLGRKGVGGDLSFMTRQNGMFSLLDLSKDQVEKLKNDHALYMVGSGRVNVAGMTESNMDEVCDRMAAVMQ